MSYEKSSFTHKKFLSLAEAAEYLCMSRRWLYRHSSDPSDKYYIPRITMGRRYCFKIEELDKFAERMSGKRKRQQSSESQ